MVTREGTSPDPEKVRAVSEWQRPESLGDLRGFLGLLGYYQRFLKGYAEVAGPLQCLLQGQGGGKKGKEVMRGTNPKGDGSRLSLHSGQVAHQAGANPSFCSMKGLTVFLFPLDGMLVHHMDTPQH